MTVYCIAARVINIRGESYRLKEKLKAGEGGYAAEVMKVSTSA